MFEVGAIVQLTPVYFLLPGFSDMPFSRFANIGTSLLRDLLVQSFHFLELLLSRHRFFSANLTEETHIYISFLHC